MSSCFNCETPISTEDRFCGNCGIALKTQGGGAAGASAHDGAPTPNDADLLAAPASASSGAEQQAGADVSQGEYSAELQPTITESSLGGGGGGSATAAARAHEPVEATP